MQHFHLTFSLRQRPSTEALLRKLAKSSFGLCHRKVLFQYREEKMHFCADFLPLPTASECHSFSPSFQKKRTRSEMDAMLQVFPFQSYNTWMELIYLLSFHLLLCHWTQILITYSDILKKLTLNLFEGLLFEDYDHVKVTEDGCNFNKSIRIRSSSHVNTLETKVRYYLPLMINLNAACRERTAS